MSSRTYDLCCYRCDFAATAVMNNTMNLETSAAEEVATNEVGLRAPTTIAIGDIVEAEWISAEDWKNGKRWATNEVGSATSRAPTTIAAVEDADSATEKVAPTNLEKAAEAFRNAPTQENAEAFAKKFVAAMIIDLRIQRPWQSREEKVVSVTVDGHTIDMEMLLSYGERASVNFVFGDKLGATTLRDGEQFTFEGDVKYILCRVIDEFCCLPGDF